MEPFLNFRKLSRREDQRKPQGAEYRVEDGVRKGNEDCKKLSEK